MKRAFDIIGALALLVVFAIPMIVIALAIRITTGNPVFFAQWRKGYLGTPFRIFKFRTMTVAEQDCQIKGLVGNAEDPRITPIGRVLRKMHLDELPQLWNVLRGDMSLVGPRPLVFSIAEEYQRYPGAEKRFAVKPGLTGWAQVGGRKRVLNNLTESLSQDIKYAAIKEGWPLILYDLKILWQTVFVVLSGQGV